jgi:hypothetical protein
MRSCVIRSSRHVPQAQDYWQQAQTYGTWLLDETLREPVANMSRVLKARARAVKVPHSRRRC